jgi:UDP-2,3-diacylglucosamine pyrophosphatase LpxH
MAQKTVIVSDIHAGGQHGWFVPPYTTATATMLRGVAADPDVVELVLLGDIFDLWLYPAQTVPWAMKDILQYHAEFVSAVRECVQKLPAVYYANGNHDMGVSMEDLAPFTVKSKAIQPLPANGELHRGWRLEHGHSVDMFNAIPDPELVTIGKYPLGYFITRIAASKKDKADIWSELESVIREHFVEDALACEIEGLGSLLVRVIIQAVATIAGVPLQTRLRFREPELDNQITVEDIYTKYYSNLLKIWHSRYPNFEQLLQTMLCSVLPDGLDWFANSLLSQKNPPNVSPENPPKGLVATPHKIEVVVFGHTHHAKYEGQYTNDGYCCGDIHEGAKVANYITVENEGGQTYPGRRINLGFVGGDLMDR